MGIADDMLKVQRELAYLRLPYEQAWQDVANLIDPFGSYRYEYSRGMNHPFAQQPGMLSEIMPVQRSREIYDSTAQWANDRLQAAVFSLKYPRAMKWHSLMKDDPFGSDETDVEEEFFDAVTDYLFANKNDYRSNFWLSMGKAVKATVTYGTGIVYSEENTGRKGIDPVKVPVFYRQIPVANSYLGIDAYDEIDKCLRFHEMPARAAVSYFGEEKLGAKVREAASDEKKQDRPFLFMHCVVPTSDLSDKSSGGPFTSFWIDVEHKDLIGTGKFFEFPYQVMWWDQADNSPYGYSPAMSVLSDMKMLQVMGKTFIQAGQQAVKPPMATLPGIYAARLNLNSGAVNPGYLNEQGMELAKPIVPAGRGLPFAERLLELKQGQVQRSFYTEVFQTLVEKPGVTATEVLVREQEKSAMLGPVGEKIGTGGAKLVDRDLKIIARKGAFDTGSKLEAPESLAGQDIGIKWKDPMSRLQRLSELQGIENVLQGAGVFANYDPSVLDRIDADETLEIIREVRGAPRRMFRLDEEVAQLREDRAQQQEQAAVMNMMEQGANAVGKATPAIQAAQAANAA